MRRLFKFYNETGDTIVEVLFSVAVLGAVLTGAYVTANRSLDTDVDSQEHAQATSLAQSQIESIHIATTNNASNPLGGDNCFSTDSVATNTCYVNISSDTFTSTCATPCGNFTIKDSLIATPYTIPAPVSASVTWNTYEVQVTWPRLGGGNNNVQMYYQSN